MRSLTCCSYGHSLIQFDPKAEAKLRLKIDLMIVPTVALLYLFCFIDRANIVRDMAMYCGATSLTSHRETPRLPASRKSSG
jgi:hypothetical protein